MLEIYDKLLMHILMFIFILIFVAFEPMEIKNTKIKIYFYQQKNLI